MRPFEPTERTTLRRRPERAVYERDAIAAILDEALVSHVGCALGGQVVVLPTIHARVGDRLYLHGAVANRVLRAARDGVELCVTATLVDGLVLARSAFHHSLNYRSVVVMGRATEVCDEEEKRLALRALVEHVVRGRSVDAREPNAAELARTLVVRLPIDEASAKVRSGPPLDDEDDYGLPIWAGVLPLTLATARPIADPRLIAGVAVPSYVTGYSRQVVPDQP